MMSSSTTQLWQKHCAPCSGGAHALSPKEVHDLLSATPGWQLTTDAKRIRREWRVEDFLTALDFFTRIGQIAEAEDHHPDLHLTGYRDVAIEIGTHSIDALSENDFILASKIDRLPVSLKG